MKRARENLYRIYFQNGDKFEPGEVMIGTHMVKAFLRGYNNTLGTRPRAVAVRIKVRRGYRVVVRENEVERKTLFAFIKSRDEAKRLARDFNGMNASGIRAAVERAEQADLLPRCRPPKREPAMLTC
jgi:hypothetical protein